MKSKYKFGLTMKFIVSLLISGVIIGSLGIYLILRGSLPMLSGEKELSGLNSTVHIYRDMLGIPSIHAANRTDVARSLGFLHAQDRFFQMDLMRRAAAGELSELFGSTALNFDKERRLHLFRFRSENLFPALSQHEREILQAYTEGVNSGLNSLKTNPFEYYLIGSRPNPWKVEDTLLVCFGLFFELQDSSGQSAIKRKMMERLLPAEIYNFFVNNGSAWESALDGSTMPILPLPDQLSFHSSNNTSSISFQPKLGGSNQWAVTKEKTMDGKAYLACDMHLELAVPNIWYRTSFHYPADDEEIQIFGVTLPGAPIMIIGSNTHIAWGFTNGHLETSSIVSVDPSATHTVIEKILVKDEEPFYFEIKESEYGPILPQSYLGNSIALSWVAHSPNALNMQLFQLEQVKDVDTAIQVSKTIKIPVLNFLVADKHSNIGWTLIGALPNQLSADYPLVINPVDHVLWSANNRTLGGKWLEETGRKSYLNGIRAHQIHAELHKLKKATPKDLLALQMETKAPFFERWQTLLIEILESSQKPKHQEILSIVKTWNGQASQDSSGYFWIRKFREVISKAILQKAFAPCIEHCSDFLSYFQDFEEPIWLIARKHPASLVDPKYQDWKEEFLSHIDKMVMEIETADIKNYTWGMQNKLSMNHPFSSGILGLGFFLDMPSVPLSGDYYVPKVAYCNDGASQRMVVSPGNEQNGIFHMPGGQSSHPLSPFYRVGHEAWVKGEASSFLPGEPIHQLIFHPSEK